MNTKELIDRSNKKVLEIIGVWLLLSDNDKWKWLREHGWTLSAINGCRWDHKDLKTYYVEYLSEDEAFKYELKRALLNK